MLKSISFIGCQRVIAATFLLCMLSTFASAQSIPNTLGWYQIPNTTLQNVCPPDNFASTGYLFSGNCKYVVWAWNSAVFDTTRNRLILWGGGHADYLGNEVYALNLNSLTIQRLTDPALPISTVGLCPEAISPGQPNARHTYDGLTYMPNVDRMFVFGGSLSWCGGGSGGTWTFNLANNTWQQRNPSGTLPRSGYGIVTSYDPNTGKVFLHDLSDLYSYNYATDSYQKLTNNPTQVDIHLTGVIDPVRKKFVMMGNGEAWIYDISTGSAYTKQALSTTGGSAIINSVYPGLAYDPVSDRVVAWNGGDTVYSLNLDTRVWTAYTYPSGPGTTGGNGTYKRWSYSPTSGVFVVVNSMLQNAFAFRFTTGGSTPPPPSDTVPPTVAVSAPTSGQTVSGTISVSANASDNFGVAGVQFKLDGVNLGAEATVSPYSVSWNTTGAANGSHTLTAVARDAAGNQATSGSVAVTVSNTSAFNFSLTNGGGKSVTRGSSITNTISASLGSGSAQSVSFSTSGLPTGAAPSYSLTTCSPTCSSNLTLTTSASTPAGTYAVTVTGRAGGLTKTTAFNLTVNTTSPPPPSSASNTAVISDTSGTTQTNRPVSISRPFRQGEIPNFAQASINGSAVLTQTDVKNRWPDGSVKFAIVSFIIPSLPANGSVTVAFSDQSTGNNTGFLTQSQLLASAYDFDGTIQMTGATVQTVSARTMLSNGHFRYWLQGPIVTAIILEDRSLTRTYDKDFGDGTKALHPIFEAWFYPQGNKVELGYTVENIWTSNTLSRSMQDQTYSLTIKSGNTNPTTEYTQATFLHVGKTRWHKSYWIGTDPGTIRIDHGTAYLVTTKAIPKYDTSVVPAESVISGRYSKYKTNSGSLLGVTSANGTLLGNYENALGQAGANDWIGLMGTWDTLYLLSMDNRMREASFGNADLAGRIPWHYREADTLAGTGKFFDAPTTGSVDTFGRIISVNARQAVALSDLTQILGSCSQYAADIPALGTVTDLQGWQTTRDHMPDVAYLPYLLSGKYYYLEELQMQATWIMMMNNGCFGYSNRNDATSRYGSMGYIGDGQTRGKAWGFRTLAYAAFISPDGTAEKDYFEDKLKNNVTKLEGVRGIAQSYSGTSANGASRTTEYNLWITSTLYDPSPIGMYDSGPAVQEPLIQNSTLSAAGTSWEEGFLVVAWGMARDFGYSTDNLLRYAAKLRFNLLLNPAAVKYYVESYRWPAKLTSSGTWITTYNWNQYYSPTSSGWGQEGTLDHGYGVIALAASSFLYPYTVDGYSGASAWNLHSTEKCASWSNQCSRFATESPKWAILPRTDVTAPPPPPPTVPPSAPTGLSLQ